MRSARIGRTSALVGVDADSIGRTLVPRPNFSALPRKFTKSAMTVIFGCSVPPGTLGR